jgi:hypothetical protein
MGKKVAVFGSFVVAEGKDLFTALCYGNVTGALSVTKLGTAPSMPSRAEIDALYEATYPLKGRIENRSHISITDY